MVVVLQNHALLVAYRFWYFYYNIILTPEMVESVSFLADNMLGKRRRLGLTLHSLDFVPHLAEIYVQTLSSAFLLLTSDIFVTLRCVYTPLQIVQVAPVILS